ncbi:MAG: Asp-tRNA(Asn)/Glu-tRNA(Gln) amidotransferase subunit GatC [Dehalococcoidia bacterium]|nr:Asp-tRNA(Asn)/Glu-tRNA(Gln) amidotransferase subunit GatC [Dehalococcoidia bacterium]
MELSREEVLHIARLARLSLTEAEIETMRSQLSNILENFEILKRLNTDDIPPTTHSVPLNTIFREDIVAPSYPEEEVLANAPQRENGYFKIRAVLEE